MRRITYSAPYSRPRSSRRGLPIRRPQRRHGWREGVRLLAPAAVLAFLIANFAGASPLFEGSNKLADHGGPMRGQENAAFNLPSLLSPDDEARYRHIFAVQESGRWQEADAAIATLDNPLLMGHVLAQRYLHPTAYRTSFAELRQWLSLYRDHPQAARLYRLARKRQPNGAVAPTRPEGRMWLGAWADEAPPPDYRSSHALSQSERRAEQRLGRDLRTLIRRGRLTAAEKRLFAASEGKRYFDTLTFDQYRALLAAGWLAFGRDKKALAHGEAAVARSGDAIPAALWTSGLAAWRTGAYETALKHFSAMAMAPAASDWQSAAGAYWAARAALYQRQPEAVNHWLSLAAKSNRSFYGLLARRTLGVQVHYDWGLPYPSREKLAALAAHPGGARALALLQTGRSLDAERELRLVYPSLEEGLGNERNAVLLAVAEAGRMPGLAMRVAGEMAVRHKHQPDAGIYPLPAWQPKEGFAVDRALVYAVMRQESRFDPEAKSHAGARGLMQLMPRTASYISGTRFRGAKRDELFDPALNIGLGQKYIAHLLAYDGVGGDLLLMATAYNGGMGNLQRWKRLYDERSGDVHAQDPLLFLETLPAPETRRFVKRILTNLWIYRERLGQETPSLDALAMGEWPRYVALDATDTAAAPSSP